MLRVPCYLAPSPIHGLGVFAAAPISAGTLVWAPDFPIDQILHPVDMPFMAPHELAFLATYAYLDPEWPDSLLLCGDHARFVNHSTSPTLVAAPPDPARGPGSVAARDLAAGEELTEDYRAWREDYAPFAPYLTPAFRP